MPYCSDCGAALTPRLIDDRERLACPACAFVVWDNPTPVIAALVEWEGQVVLARNVAWPEGNFSVITGFLEKGETPEECALREVEEELGLRGEIAGHIGHTVFARQNQLILGFHVIAHGEIRLNAELAELRLIPPERLKPWNFGTGPLVRDWLIQRGLLPAG